MSDVKQVDREIESLMETILNNKDEIQKLQQESEDCKAKLIKLMEGNFYDSYESAMCMGRATIYSYSKELVNKEKCEKMLHNLRTHQADVDSIKMSDFTKESKIKFVKVSYVD